MDIETLRSFFLWCTIINMLLLLWWWMILSVAHDWVFRMHTRWFKLSPEDFDATHYSGMAHFKIAIFVFNLVPYLALLIVD